MLSKQGEIASLALCQIEADKSKPTQLGGSAARQSALDVFTLIPGQRCSRRIGGLDPKLSDDLSVPFTSATFQIPNVGKSKHDGSSSIIG